MTTTILAYNIGLQHFDLYLRGKISPEVKFIIENYHVIEYRIREFYYSECQQRVSKRRSFNLSSIISALCMYLSSIYPCMTILQEVATAEAKIVASRLSTAPDVGARRGRSA